jgi:hypothetical protein
MGLQPAALGPALSSLKADNADQLHVFYIGTNQHVSHLWYANGWLSEDVTGLVGAPQADAGAPLISFQSAADGQIHFLYSDSNQHVDHFWYSGAWFSEDLTQTLVAQIDTFNSSETCSAAGVGARR